MWNLLKTCRIVVETVSGTRSFHVRYIDLYFEGAVRVAVLDGCDFERECVMGKRKGFDFEQLSRRGVINVEEERAIGLNYFVKNENGKHSTDAIENLLRLFHTTYTMK